GSAVRNGQQRRGRMSQTENIVERLRARAVVSVEWQIVNQATEGIVAWFGSDYLDPEREARQWLEQHSGSLSTHEVRRVKVLSLHDEAADEIVRLRHNLEAASKDQRRFRHLQSIDPKIAQAFFWHHKGRKQRVEAIDRAVASADSTPGSHLDHRARQ